MMQLKQIFATYDWRENSGTDRIKYCPLCGTLLRLEEVASRPRPTCPECSFVYFRNPFPTVSVFVIEDDQVLLGKRAADPGKGKWGPPSGYIEFDEDFLTAAVREVKEETGVDVQIRSIINVQSAFLPPEYHFLGIYLRAELVAGELKAGDDMEIVDWFPLSGPLPEMAFDPDTEAIEALAKGKIEELTATR